MIVFKREKNKSWIAIFCFWSPKGSGLPWNGHSPAEGDALEGSRRVGTAVGLQQQPLAGLTLALQEFSFPFCKERWSRGCAAWCNGGAEQLVGGKQVQENVVCLIFRTVIVKLVPALLPTELTNVSQLHHSSIIAAREVKNNTANQNNVCRKTWFIKPMFRAHKKELQDTVTWVGAWTSWNSGKINW